MTPDPYSLDNLRDIVEPASIPWWPPAPGVWLLLALVAVWTVAGLGLWWVRWRRQAYRRAGLRELRVIAARLDAAPERAAALVDLAALLKRVALVAYAREQVAALSGDAWLTFLDRTGGTARFARRLSAVLAAVSSRPGLGTALDTAQVEALVAWSPARSRRGHPTP
jgi:Domain of unknown function (DUF4381)